MIGPSQVPQPEIIQQSQETGNYAPGGIRTQNSRSRAVADPALDYAATEIGKDLIKSTISQRYMSNFHFLYNFKSNQLLSRHYLKQVI